jgi:hypothetical protein
LQSSGVQLRPEQCVSSGRHPGKSSNDSATPAGAGRPTRGAVGRSRSLGGSPALPRPVLRLHLKRTDVAHRVASPRPFALARAPAATIGPEDAHASRHVTCPPFMDWRHDALSDSRVARGCCARRVATGLEEAACTVVRVQTVAHAAIPGTEVAVVANPIARGRFIRKIQRHALQRVGLLPEMGCGV